MTGFDPDWVVAPGETLREWREENRLGVQAAATACARMPRAMYEEIEAGTQQITPDIAAALAHGTHIPAYLWLNLEAAYRTKGRCRNGAREQEVKRHDS